ncbi:MAG TPA: flagellar basal body-associated FliL family protein [Vicinamibacterales bacterium]|nr:flagellar basal body-associated FliL family protein [Vicinamibacterales bacterium]
MTTPAPGAAPAGDSPAPPPKSKKLLLILVIAILAVAGGAAFWVMKKRTAPATESHEKQAAAADAAAGVVSFEPFIVNLADGGGSRFLRLTVRLVLPSEEAEHLSKNEVALARARSAILEVLSEQSSDRLVTAAGKADLKKAILERADGVFRPAKVDDVLFSDFVVQF